MADVAPCTSKKSVIGIEVGGYSPAAFDFLCSSNAEAERIADAINAARRGMFVGERTLESHEEAAQPPRLPPKDEVYSAKPAATSPPPISPMPFQTHAQGARENALVLYDFGSDDPEELDVREGDRVLVLDKSDPEWWHVQLDPPNGRAGLVPSSYLELSEDEVAGPAQPVIPQLPTRTETVRRAASQVQMSSSASPVQQTARDVQAPPLPPPPALASEPPSTGTTLRRQKTTDSDNVPLNVLQRRQDSGQKPLPGPDPSKVRTWTDRSGAYTVDAQFLSFDGDGRVHLHKTNGAKIVVSLAKFSEEDRRYVDGVAMPQKPAKSMTARQRQQEEAKRNPGKRAINYDWDWFDFFTLKGGVSADNALKYATSFVADRLDDKSIPDITAQTMEQLGVKPDDITRLVRAFRIHQGLADEGPNPTSDDFFSQLEGSKSPVQQKPQSPAPYQPTTLEPKKPATNNPWGVDSELDRRFRAKSQIEEDEAFARQLQKEEEDIARGKKPVAKKQANPFASFDSPSPTTSGSQRPQPAPAANKQSLNLGAANRKIQRTPTSVVDPAQFRSTQQMRATSPVTPTSAVPARSSNINALDQAFGSGAPSPRSPPAQKDAPPRPRPSAKPQHIQQHQQQLQLQQQQPNISANMAPLVASPATTAPATTTAGLGGLTTNAMAAAAAAGNNAQVERLEQMARAKAQELSAQELQLKQQQEQIRQQALFLQQQQQQLLQAQQTQKVELQLKQLKEEREKLEQKRQADALKQQ
ncbi:cytoskeletal protein binding protein, partial [Linderina pennispora]